MVVVRSSSGGVCSNCNSSSISSLNDVLYRAAFSFFPKTLLGDRSSLGRVIEVSSYQIGI